MYIRTVTFQRARNCGAAMQAYALMKYLQILGNKVEILDYCPDWLYDQMKPFKQFREKPSVKGFIVMFFSYIQVQKYIRFVRECCQVTPKVYKKEEVSQFNDCDLYVVGSDQVWNPEITLRLDDIYLLNFPTKAKKISYSASCGLDNLSDDIIDPIVSALKNFEAVAVREHYLEDKLKSKGVSVVGVLDPVFLLNANDYRAVDVPYKCGKYLVIYVLYHSDQLLKFAKRIADNYGLKIVTIGGIRKKWPADYTVWNYGPREWLGLIDGADFVLTNSFHGTALSIIFRKNVYVMRAGNRNSRIESVLSDFGMQDRFVEDSEIDTIEITETDYSKYEDNIQKHIEKSKNFLKEHCCEKN